MKQRFFFFAFLILFSIPIIGQLRIETTDYISYINKDSIERTMRDLEAFTTRYATLGNRHIAEYIQQRLINYGVTNAVVDSFYKELDLWFDPFNPLFNGYFYNVRGSISGTQNPESIVIIGAHYDAVNLVIDDFWNILLNKDLTPGADDNASGVAVILEMARIIRQYNLKPQNRIDFLAFDAEELDLNGGAYDAQRRIDENDNVIMMINNDMVSYQPLNEDYMINIHWYDNAVDEAEHAASFCSEYSSIMPVLPQGVDNSLREASDSWEYAHRGIKSVFFIEHFFTPNYHTMNDICDSSNFDYVREVGKVNFALLNHYAEFDRYSDVQIIENQEFFSVYPNPIQSLVSVNIPSFAENTSYRLQLFDVYGRLCYTATLTQQRTHLNLSELSNSLYFMQLVTPEGKSYSQKIFKQ